MNVGSGQGLSQNKFFNPLANNTFDTGTFTNLTVTNELIVNILKQVQTVEIKDNLLLINSGETGSGVTLGTAGIQVDRGLLTDYQFIFDEASDWFKIGEIGSLQRVATCEDSPIDTALAYYDLTTKRFITDTNIKRTSSGTVSFTNVVASTQISSPTVRATKVYPTGLDLQIGQSTTGRKTQIGRNLNTTFEAQLSVNDNGDIEATKVMQTVEGGIAIKLTNNTGSTLLRGYIVSVDSSGDIRVKLTPIDSPDTIGVIYQDIANGASGWVVVSGMAYVIYANNATRGQFARSCKTGDTGAAAGKAFAEAIPTPPTADTHFYEIGHVLESKTAGALTLTVLHFN